MEQAPDRLKQRLEREANRMMVTATLYGFGLAALSFFALLGLDYFAGFPALEVPTLWAGICAMAMFFLYEVAKRQWVRGDLLPYVVSGFTVSLPLVIYGIAHFRLPAGATTYLHGPPSYLFFFLLVIVGFFFNRKVSLFAGVLAAAEYLLVIFLSLEGLKAIQASDPLLYFDLISVSNHIFKAVMLLFTGLAMAAMGDYVLGQMRGIQTEEEERARVGRLFGQFVSGEVAERLIQEKQDVLGEAKEVALLFSDIRGFTTFCEGKSPAEVVSRLNQYFDQMVEAITAHGGVVDKFIGDAIMANFGGLVELKNPSAAAFEAAQAMRNALGELNARWVEEGLEPLENGIGLHFGEVLQGPLGSQKRREFTLIGDAVNLASRLESLTKDLGCPLLVSGALFERLDAAQQAQLEAKGSHQVKGKQAQVQVYGCRSQGPA